MKQVTAKQHAKIHPYLPVQRGNVRISNIVFINAILLRPGEQLQVMRPAGAVRQLVHGLRPVPPLVPQRLTRAAVRRASGAGSGRQGYGLLRPRQHQHQGASRRHRARKKNGPQSIGKSRGGWNTKTHMVSAARSYGIAPVPIGHTAYMWMYDRDDDGCVCE